MSYAIQVKSSDHTRVLLVEGEGHFGKLYRQILSAAGYDVVMVPTGEQALQRLCSDRFDIILTDYRLPDMRGDQLVRSIRQIESGIGIIFISARPDVVRLARRCGADAYYAKWEPFSCLLANIRGLVSDTRKAIPHVCQIGERSM